VAEAVGGEAKNMHSAIGRALNEGIVAEDSREGRVVTYRRS
jgi:hypothetical protein